MSSDYKVYRSINNLEAFERWNLLMDYLSLKMTNEEIADKYQIKKRRVEDFVAKVYKRFQVARETNLLLSNRSNASLFQVMRDRYVNSDHINRNFCNLLSPEDSLALSDPEILYCEILMEYGDEVRAIEESGLDTGLGNKKKEAGPTYREACILRSFYLKKKPNVANYLNQEKKKKLKKIEGGKEYLQEHLITLIEELRNSGDRKNLTSLLKATEQLGRTIGAFDDKMTVNTFDGDAVLDTILEKAKKINAEELEESTDSPDLIAYVDGEEIYERKEE